MPTFLDFEKPIAEIEGKIEELRHRGEKGEAGSAEEMVRLQQRADRLLRQTYAKLTAWQKTLVARHPDRPHFTDYVRTLIRDFVPLSGDRTFANDLAILGGIGRFRGRSVMIIGHEKGADTASRLRHNFAMARPEGYRKVQRLMAMADRFRLPVVTLVDTPGAYPGVDAEARGQAQAIARCIETCLDIRVPLVAAVIGEGGSGGAIALAAANHIVMLEYAVYSVISPEGCASILWRSADQAQVAAEALKLTASDLRELGVIDAIVGEPVGGAHRGAQETIAAIGDHIEKTLVDLAALDGESLRAGRRRKFLDMGKKALA
jgi:acetyl-CoA carboxylase carboxyl transferase subunit alpha